jgi:hypothetical protein
MTEVRKKESSQKGLLNLFTRINFEIFKGKQTISFYRFAFLESFLVASPIISKFLITASCEQRITQKITLGKVCCISINFGYTIIDMV